MWITCEQNPCRSQKHPFNQNPDKPVPLCNSLICFHENLYQQRFARIDPWLGKNSKNITGISLNGVQKLKTRAGN